MPIADMSRDAGFFAKTSTILAASRKDSMSIETPATRRDHGTEGAIIP